MFTIFGIFIVSERCRRRPSPNAEVGGRSTPAAVPLRGLSWYVTRRDDFWDTIYAYLYRFCQKSMTIQKNSIIFAYIF